MTSKEESLTRRSEDTASWQAPPLLKRRYYRGDPAEFLPYRIEPGHDAPAFLPIGAEVQVRFTTSIHGPDGQLTSDVIKVMSLSGATAASPCWCLATSTSA